MVATEQAGGEGSTGGGGGGGGWVVVGCSHRQAHSSCSACWDALGSALHNTITACSGVLCRAQLRSDYVLMSFVPFTLFQLCRVPPPFGPFVAHLHFIIFERAADAIAK